MRCLHVLLWQDGSGSSGLFTSLKCEFLASRLPGLHSCIFAWFWFGRGSEYIAVVEETLDVLVYITANVQKQERPRQKDTPEPPIPRPRFHKRRVQVHSKSVNLLRLHLSSKESTNTLFWQNRLDPVWPVWLQLEDANWNRLSLKWDRTLVDWYQARIRAATRSIASFSSEHLLSGST